MDFTAVRREGALGEWSRSRVEERWQGETHKMFVTAN